MGFIRKWVQHYVDNGGFRALKDPIGDYNVVYQYIMAICSYLKISSLYTAKLFSIAFDFILAWGCWKCLSHFGVSKAACRIIFVVVLLLPTVWLNSALWCQCDSIYVSFIVWSLYFILKGKNYRAVVLASLAFTFKLQTVFFLPLFLLLLLKRQIRLRHLLAFPVTYCQMINVVTPHEMLEKVGILLAGIVVLTFLILCLTKKGKADDKTLLSLAMVGLLCLF